MRNRIKILVRVVGMASALYWGGANVFARNPKRVRYGWQPFPEPALNLVNGLDQPASPFMEPIE